jgi:hypothetical protein
MNTGADLRKFPDKKKMVQAEKLERLRSDLKTNLGLYRGEL